MRHRARLLIPCLLLACLPVPATSQDGPADDLAPDDYTSDERLSSLRHGCSVRYTMSPDWRRLWLECGCATFLVMDVNNLVGQVRIDTPDRALELLGLFSAPQSCHLIPDQPWVEVRAAEKDGWLSLAQERFDDVCPVPTVRETTTATSGGRVFHVRRCLLSSVDGHLHDVTHQVLEDGMVMLLEDRIVLEDARSVVGSCSPLD